MNQKNIVYYLQLITQVGLTMVLCILIGGGVGFFIDKKLHIKGVFTILFLIFGIIGGFLGVYRMLKIDDN